MQKKKIKHHLTYLTIIFLTIICLIAFLQNKYIYFAQEKMFNNMFILTETSKQNEFEPEIQIKEEKKILPLNNKMNIKINNQLGNITNVINVIKVDKLEPLQTYKFILDLEIENIPDDTKIIIGAQQEEIKSINTTKTEKKLNTINYENSQEFYKTENNREQIPLEIITDENGQSYIYLKFDVQEIKNIDYKLSKIRLIKEGN